VKGVLLATFAFPSLRRTLAFLGAVGIRGSPLMLRT